MFKFAVKSIIFIIMNESLQHMSTDFFLSSVNLFQEGWYSSLNVVDRLWILRPENHIQFLVGTRNFSLVYSIKSSCGITLYNGFWEPAQEADFSSPSSVKFKNAWSYSPAPLRLVYLWQHTSSCQYLTVKKNEKQM